MHKKIHVVLLEERLHFCGDLLHDPVTREQNKGATLGFGNEVRHPMSDGLGISGVARIRHFPDNEKFHLLGKIERAPELQRLDLVGTNPFSKIGEIRPPYGKGGAGHHAGAIFTEKHPA